MSLPTKTAWKGPLVYHTVEQIDHAATGQTMRQLRKSHGVSLREVARRMKLSAPFVSDLELGRRNWTVDLALKFMSASTREFIAHIQKAQDHENQKDFHIGSAARTAQERKP